MRVHSGCYDPKHPQERLVPLTDPTALFRPSPEQGSIPPVLSGEAGATGIELTWTAAQPFGPRIEYYKLFRSLDNETFTQIYTAPVVYDDFMAVISEPLSYTDEDTTADTEYTYYVSAYNAYDHGLSSNRVTLQREGEDGELVIWPMAVMSVRTQGNIGVEQVPNGYSAVGGEVSLPNGGKAIISRGPSLTGFSGGIFSARVTGEDENADIITEDISVGGGVYYTVGTTTFYKITGITLLSSTIGTDAGYCAGYRYQVTPSGTGFNMVTERGALAIRQSVSTGSISLNGLRYDSGNPLVIPDDSIITFMRFANTSAKDFTIQGSEVVSMPTGAKGQEVEGVTTYSGTLSNSDIVASLSGSVFLDIGLKYRQAV